MTVVTGLTAEKMLELSDLNIISGHVDAGSLILMTRGGDMIDAGSVEGPTGPAGSGYTIVTSSSRPLDPISGMVIWETDTGLVRVWDGDRWRAQERYICTEATRPDPLFASDEGMVIYETDTNTEYMWDGSAWQFYQRPTIICTSTTRPASPIVGTKIYETNTGKTLQYYSAGTGWQPGDWATSWGQVAYALSTTDHGVVFNVGNILGMSAQWVACARRYYKTTMHMPRNQNNGTFLETQAFYYDGDNNQVSIAYAKSLNANEVFSIHSSIMEGGIPNGLVTRKMRALSSNAAGVRYNGLSFKGNIMVEDVGPAGPPL